MSCIVYFLCHEDKDGRVDTTYTGSTIDLKHRMRQHLGEIKGGSKYVRMRGKNWRVGATIENFPSPKAARSFEAKHKQERKRKGRRSPLGVWDTLWRNVIRTLFLRRWQKRRTPLRIVWHRNPPPSAEMETWPDYTTHESASENVCLGDVGSRVRDTRTAIERMVNLH